MTSSFVANGLCLSSSSASVAAWPSLSAHRVMLSSRNLPCMPSAIATPATCTCDHYTLHQAHLHTQPRKPTHTRARTRIHRHTHTHTHTHTHANNTHTRARTSTHRRTDPTHASTKGHTRERSALAHTKRKRRRASAQRRTLGRRKFAKTTASATSACSIRRIGRPPAALTARAYSASAAVVVRAGNSSACAQLEVLTHCAGTSSRYSPILRVPARGAHVLCGCSLFGALAESTEGQSVRPCASHVHYALQQRIRAGSHGSVRPAMHQQRAAQPTERCTAGSTYARQYAYGAHLLDVELRLLVLRDQPACTHTHTHTRTRTRTRTLLPPPHMHHTAPSSRASQ